VRENLRRFWAIGAFGFLCYFFIGVFPAVISADGSPHYIYMTLNMVNPFFVFIACLFPVIAAVALFRYLHGAGSASVMHSLPFTRRTLLNSFYLSGFALLALPVIAAALCFMAALPTNDGSSYYYRIEGAPFESMSAGHVLNWLAMTLILLLFLYTVCVLAGIVTGSAGMHVVVCAMLNALPPGLLAIALIYCDEFLFGFGTGLSQIEFATKLSPLLLMPASEGLPGAAAAAAFIVASVLLIALSSFLYSRRPLERAGHSLCFRFMEAIICCFAALLGMTAMGWYFYAAAGEGRGYMYLGMCVGGLIAFAVARIVVKRTPRVLDRESLAQLAACGLGAVLLVGGLNFDVFGYGSRVPEPGRVESAAFNADFLDIYQHRLDVSASFDDEATLRDPGNIEAMTAFHRRVAGDRGALESSPVAPRDFGAVTQRLELEYRLLGGGAMLRIWELPWEEYARDESLGAIFESGEFKALRSLKRPEFGALRSVSLSDGEPMAAYFGQLGDIRLSAAQERELLDCIEKDMRLEGYEQFLDLSKPLAKIYMVFDGVKTDGGYMDASVNVPESYENTVGWFRENGLYGRLTAWKDAIASIELVQPDDGQHEPGGAQWIGIYDYAYDYETQVYTVSDLALIREAAEQGRIAALKPDDWRADFRFDMSKAVIWDEGAYVEEPGQAYRGGGVALTLYFDAGDPLIERLLAAAE
jgi:ABC-2 type transport system permease protein